MSQTFYNFTTWRLMGSGNKIVDPYGSMILPFTSLRIVKL